MTGQNPNIRAHADASGDWGGHWDIEFWADDLKKVKQIIDGMKPEDVERASRVYAQVKQRIESTMNLIYSQSRRLAESWSGQDAEAALRQWQKAYDAAYEVFDKSGTTEATLHNHADWQSRWKGAADNWAMDFLSSTVGQIATAMSPIGGFANNEAADKIMEQLQEQTVQSNNNFPASIGASMPGKTGLDSINPNESNPGHVGGGIPNMPGGGAPGTSNLPGSGSPGHIPGGSGDGTDHFPGGFRTDTVPAGRGGTDLAGADLPGGGGGGLGAGGLGAGAGAGGLGATGVSPGNVGSGGLGAGGPVGGFPGAGMGAGAAGKSGMGGMGGGMGHGGGGEEEERERTTWLAEDEDVWGGDSDAAPPVIG